MAFDATALDPATAAAMLSWQVELGATEAIGDVPVDRYDLPAALPRQTPVSAPATTRATARAPAGVPSDDADPIAAAVETARALAGAADSLEALRAAIASYELCALKKGARNLVFSDGNPAARVMIVGEAPGREEDLQGKPFVGRAGKLLDAMLAAIGLGRSNPDGDSVYITNILPWQPPGNRDPRPDEIAMMRPFVERHVALAAPDVLILMGNISCQALLGRKGITRLRGAWTEALDLPVLPMFHPAYLLRNPVAKRDAWADLLMLQHRLRQNR